MTMRRFTTRDLLWGTIVVGLLLGRWLDQSNSHSRLRQAELRAEAQASAIKRLATLLDDEKPGWRHQVVLPIEMP